MDILETDRHTMAFKVVLAIPLLLVAAALGQTQSLDSVMEDFTITDISAEPCTAFAALEQIARRLPMSVGFEHAGSCSGSWGLEGTEAVSGMTGREVIARVLSVAGDFEARQYDGVVVARPKDTWDDSDSFLNRRVRPVKARNVPLPDALREVLRAVVPLEAAATDGRTSATAHEGLA